MDLDQLRVTAAAILDGASARFVDALGAPSAVTKGSDDFATAIDLELERRISGELTDATGIGVHGEEFGGPELETGATWVLDPIDGTYNYSSGLPLCGILLALVQDGQPLIGLTWLPLLHQRFSAVAGGPLLIDGVPAPRLQPQRLSSAMIGFGAFNAASRTGAYRHRLVGLASQKSSRLRMHGSTGVDLAFTAAGVLGGAVVFGHHPWDNAAGVALVRAAGGVVSDHAGRPWSVSSGGVLAAAPGVHEELLAVISSATAEQE